jgi:hypothetical protein
VRSMLKLMKAVHFGRRGGLQEREARPILPAWETQDTSAAA